MSDVLPLADAEATLSELVDRVDLHHDRITITRDGRPVAVLVSAHELAALEDSLELLSDPTAMADIVRARQEAAAGRTVSANQLRAQFPRH